MPGKRPVFYREEEFLKEILLRTKDLANRTEVDTFSSSKIATIISTGPARKQLKMFQELSERLLELLREEVNRDTQIFRPVGSNFAVGFSSQEYKHPGVDPVPVIFLGLFLLGRGSRTFVKKHGEFYKIYPAGAGNIAILLHFDPDYPEFKESVKDSIAKSEKAGHLKFITD